MYKSERLELRLTHREIQMLDEIRGHVTRSAWIRNQILRVHMAHARVRPIDHPTVEQLRDDNPPPGI